MNWQDRIVADADVLAGKPVVRGTRQAGKVHHRPVGTGMERSRYPRELSWLEHSGHQGLSALRKRCGAFG